MPKYAYTLLCRSVNEISLQMIQVMTQLDKYQDYDFYVMIDNNNQNITLFQIKYPKIHFVQINDQECLSKGYHHMTYSIRKTPVSWDKSYYYFAELNDQYDFIWFIEDDLFVPSPLTIYDIDQKYPDYHLLSKSNTLSTTYDNPNWQWSAAKGHIGLPLFSTLLCGSRISQKLLHIVRDYARTHHKLFFLEIMIPTLCSQNMLPNKCIPEMSTIEYRTTWKLQDIQPSNLYHPIKDVAMQKLFYEWINRGKSF